jgi:hypothetical protein
MREGKIFEVKSPLIHRIHEVAESHWDYANARTEIEDHGLFSDLKDSCKMRYSFSVGMGGNWHLREGYGPNAPYFQVFYSQAKDFSQQSFIDLWREGPLLCRFFYETTEDDQRIKVHETDRNIPALAEVALLNFVKKFSEDPLLQIPDHEIFESTFYRSAVPGRR